MQLPVQNVTSTLSAYSWRQTTNMSKSFWAFCCGALLFVASAGATGQPHLLGGPRDIDLNKDENAKDALTYAIQRHNTNTTDNYLSDVSQVLNAQSQVVAGMKYFITVQMVRTDCRKNRADEGCGPTDPPKNYQCTFVVWSRPWLNDIQLLKETCP
uniref:Cystatin C (amyloid angiopathy and cerebral hemorrhage) n=1 Tax=Neogobius melanostomus TaxID=47308 RepID=A0A8C6SDR1_9GOBI